MKKATLLSIFFFFFVTVKAQKKIIVALDGSGDYQTVQQAINAVPDNSNTETEILIKKGTYKEKLVLPASKKEVHFIGEDATNTILTYDDYAGKKDTSGKDLGTSRSASFYIYGAGFTAKNITFQNSAGPVGQAVAVYVAGDRCCFIGCRFLGFQDTVYTYGRGTREYYKNCYIEGTTDYIFGASTALFEGCQLFCKSGGYYLTAASTLDTTAYGYVFIKCKITGNAPDNSYHLGRPWRPYAKVVYLYCEIDSMIKPEGWDNWRNPENEKTAYYAEYKNTGPGYQPNQRVTWSHQLTDAEASKYTMKQILRDWNPDSK
ncbi:pectinesterase [Mucilaginibacter gracilis]|uniref:Pectinesterase n=1 Tax=Mucilaginibacter gracilis TaxID=423350 RepID=A0A495IXQ1_9SPHI|nr:pectinesterase family protein [Mucilaginibacter gracilis]RKR81476.1 pectinesterase [Mucilaginibacter gracilis]